MCEYLLNVSRSISPNGVPQGPAYARYLAEIYLASIDRLILDFIDDKFEHYFRYVDDMVIILENKTKASFLIEMISEHLKKYDLELNDKRIEGSVSNLKYEIVNEDLEKYFIDGIDEANTPKEVIHKATKLLNNMFRKDSYEINIKQMPFYLTHLVNEDYLKSVLIEIVEEVSQSEIGRGSLFKHFYRNIVFKYLKEIDIDFYKNLAGLSRGNFINELSNNFEKLPREKIEEIITHFLRLNLNNYETIELYRLVLKLGLPLNRDLVKENFEILIELIKSTDEIVWNTEILEQTLINLQQNDKKLEVLDDLDNILSNSKEIEEYKRLTETIFTTISENDSTIFKAGNRQVTYNLICFISMFLDEAKIRDVWLKFNEYYKKFQEYSEVPSLIYHDWYKYKQIIKKEKLEGSSIILILTRVFKKEGIVL